LAVAVTTGMGIVVASYSFNVPMMFVVAVPLQLVVFVLLTLTSSWLASEHPYA